jgi:signal transduction histidine kinase
MAAPGAGALAALGWTIAVLGLVEAWVAGRRRARCAELVARACHELRGPLHAAGLGLHAAARDAGPGQPSLAAVGAELDRARLALADLAAAPSGRTAIDTPGPVELATLLAAQVASWAPVAATEGRRVVLREPAAPVLVHGEALRLAQAIGNLLGNAVEHGRGEVGVRLRIAAPARVAVEVTDEGAGLPAPVAALARRPRAGRGARGRGLAIAAEVAARHGGRLSAAPAGSGARLVLELPVLHPAGSRAGDAPRAGAAAVRAPAGSGPAAP